MSGRLSCGLRRPNTTSRHFEPSQPPDALWDIVVFHAQQAAEEYLKALLVDHDKVVPKIHDLERLLDLCVQLDASLPSLSTECRRLTQLGFGSRYPDSPEEPSEHDGREAMDLAVRICDAIRLRLRRAEPRENGRPLTH